MLKDDEQFIFKRMAEGDKKAFHYFFEKYYDDICNFINFYVRNYKASEGIAQDIFIYFWEKRDKIEIQTSVKAYLLKASKNKSLNHLRDERSKLTIHQKLATTPKYKSITPSDLLESEQLRGILDKAQDNLPEKCREIFKMAKEDNLKYQEIALKLNISVKTVENQMGIAFKKLRSYLEPYHNEILFIFLIFWIN
ncbi:MAG TPA: RNA polymerase sigma-70 factor [Draconibacterium sp.]|nr:RNA polymerase sigma-70 factor [Draconibacterium sp.]